MKFLFSSLLAMSLFNPDIAPPSGTTGHTKTTAKPIAEQKAVKPVAESIGFDPERNRVPVPRFMDNRVETYAVNVSARPPASAP